MFKKVLIANRGEIALRINRACHEMGIKTVAVHSKIDDRAMHVRLADESVCIGSHQPADSYLNIPAILSAVELTNSEAVHPGYGFLSENPEFAKILEENNIKFIGPSSKLIKMMGDKIQAKKIAKEYGLPVIEGSDGGISDKAEDLRFGNDKKLLDKLLGKLEFLFNKYLIKENKSSFFIFILKVTTKILSIFQDKELKKKFKLYD